jgi:hypothetical protein
MKKTCNLCGKNIEPDDPPYVSIPMDANCTRFSGTFCSTEHALTGNKYLNDGSRQVDDWQKREAWLVRKSHPVDNGNIMVKKKKK